MMQLNADDFELFGLKRRFVQDGAVLDARWKDLQRQAHPDKFAAEGAAAQRLAMQWSVRINEAYQRLRDPLKRAAYLCELQQTSVNADNNTAMPAAFLLQQMQWREDLEAAEGVENLKQLGRQCNTVKREVLQKIEHLMDREHNFQAAAGQVRMLMFLERFGADVDARLDQLHS